MATYDQLPVYKTSYDLLLELFQCIKHCSREYKYTVGENVKTEVLLLVRSVFRANSVRQRSRHIQTAREHIETVRIYVRLLKDLRQISTETLVSLNQKIESINKQLVAWQKSSQ